MASVLILKGFIAFLIGIVWPHAIAALFLVKMTSWVWEYFTKSADGREVVCKVCSGVVGACGSYAMSFLRCVSRKIPRRQVH
jgi:hypothetical protein